VKYKYKGRGERVVTAEDFASLGVEHGDVYFTEDNGCVQDLTEEAAEALIRTGESLVVEVEDEAEDDTQPEEVPKPRSGRKVKDQPQA